MAQRSPPPLAKLTRPRLHRVLMRERLFARLDEARAHNAGICVIGPPGAGKTTLVASWLQERQIPGIWYQVDPGDADLATFFHYLSRACAPARKSQRQLPAFAPEFALDTAGFARRFFRLLFERMPTGSVLTLDNYQEVPAASVFHGVIVEALREVPPGIQLIVISRRDPPDCYARLVANRQVTTLDWEELRLTPDEVRAIARAHPGSQVDDVDALGERCQGWVAGLTLMLERGRVRTQVPDTGNDASHEALFDYFASEIFDVLPATAQVVLMRTALVPSVTPDLARGITDIDTAGNVLEDIHRRRLFTDQRKASQVRYQFHPLFREFLLRRLRASLSADDHRALSARAAGLLEAAGEEHEAAVQLYLQAQDLPAAGRLIRALAPALIGQGRWQTLAQWIGSLPLPFVAADP